MSALLASEKPFRTAMEAVARRGCGWVLCLAPMRAAQMVVLESLYLLWDVESGKGELPRITFIDNEPASATELARLNDIEATMLGLESMDVFVGTRTGMLCEERETEILATAAISSLGDIGACLRSVHEGRVVVSRIMARHAADALDLISSAIVGAAPSRLAASPFREHLTEERLARTPIHLVWRQRSDRMRAWSVVKSREDMASLLTHL